MKKLLALILVAALCVSLFGCTPTSNPSPTGDQDPGNSTEPSSMEGTEPTTPAITDFGGYNLVIGDWMTSENDGDPEFTSAWEEFVYNYQKSLEKQYNYTIGRKNISLTGDYTELVPAKIMAGDKDVQMYYFFLGYILPSVSQNLLWDLTELDSFDPTDPKWSKISVDTFTFYDGGIYAVDTAVTEPRMGMFYNKRLLEEAGLDPMLPYELQASGEWSWAKFEELCAAVTRDTDKDGKTDIWAYASTYGNMAVSAVWSNGAAFVTKDEEGKFVDGTGTPEFLEAMEWLQKLSANGWLYKKPTGGTGNYALEAFQEGRLAFLPYNYWLTAQSYIADCVDDWGWVYLPYGPSAGSITMSVQCNGYGIPKTIEKEEAEKIFQIFDLMTSVTTSGAHNDWSVPGASEYEDTFWREAYGNVVRDSRAIDETLYKMIFDESTWTIDYYRMIPGFVAGNYTSAIVNMKATPAEQIEAERPANQAAISAANKLLGF